MATMLLPTDTPAPIAASMRDWSLHDGVGNRAGDQTRSYRATFAGCLRDPTFVAGMPLALAILLRTTIR